MADHGGTDAGPRPRWDFSTNANPLGPCPTVLAAVREADFARYPDPDYTALRAALADWHGTAPCRIVVGAGASELILRLVRAVPGPVRLLGPSFSEYARCGRMEGRAVQVVATPAEFLALQRQPDGIGFLCWPNNPTGEVWPAAFVAEAAAAGRLVVDLAYAPLCPPGVIGPAAAAGAVRLHAPNKAFGLTGIRAAYAEMPADGWPALAALAPAWVLGADGVAFLDAMLSPPAQAWLAETRPVMAGWRAGLAAALRARGLAVRESPASFLMARCGPATALAARLRGRGLKVRDGSSFGLPDWIRLAAAPPAWQAALLEALAAEAVPA